jgi:hypothetical protein
VEAWHRRHFQPNSRPKVPAASAIQPRQHNLLRPKLLSLLLIRPWRRVGKRAEHGTREEQGCVWEGSDSTKPTLELLLYQFAAPLWSWTLLWS